MLASGYVRLQHGAAVRAFYHQIKSNRRAYLFTTLIILAMIAIGSSVLDAWLYSSARPAAVTSHVPNAIHYAALLALLVTAIMLRRTGRTQDAAPLRGEDEERHAQAARPEASRGELSAQTDQTLALLQTVLAGFVDNPQSPESFQLLLREIERLIGANCSAIFIFNDFDTHGLPLACTDPAERDGFVDLVRERVPTSGLNDLEAILTLADPPHPGTQIIAVLLTASDGVKKGLLLVKRQSTLLLTSAETALLAGVGKHLAAIICSAQRARLNRRVALCEERAVIARELHDSLAQSLTYLKIQTSRLQSLLQSSREIPTLNHADADAVLQELRTSLNLAYRQLRELITTFRLTMNGRTLGQALKDSVEEFENLSSVAFTLDNRVPDGLLSVDEEMHILQIVRECVCNVVRHAQARRADVSLCTDGSGVVRVTVDDDGVGIDQPHSPDQHYGLVIVQQRAHGLGGDMRVLRSPDGGTRICVSLPPLGATPGLSATASTHGSDAAMNDVETQSVLIIDDHPLFRKGVAQLLAMAPEFAIVGEAASGQEGIDLAFATRPDLILLDLNMRDMNGVQTLSALKEADLNSLVIMLTVSNAIEDLIAALRSGADGYLLKDMEPEVLLAKLRSAVRGQVVLDQSVAGMLAHALCEDNRARPVADANLTEREHEILELLAEGMSNKLIARRLHISDGTVKVHVKNLLRKLNLRSRLEAAVWVLGREKR